MDVYLYRVGRNLNRAYRTAEAFGAGRLILIECRAEMAGNLYNASGRVEVLVLDGVPRPEGLLSLETYHRGPIRSVPWRSVSGILIGGETSGIPRGMQADFRATIPLVGKVSGLTVEAAMAIALYEWRQQTC